MFVIFDHFELSQGVFPRVAALDTAKWQILVFLTSGPSQTLNYGQSIAVFASHFDYFGFHKPPIKAKT